MPQNKCGANRCGVARMPQAARGLVRERTRGCRERTRGIGGGEGLSIGRARLLPWLGPSTDGARSVANDALPVPTRSAQTVQRSCGYSAVLATPHPLQRRRSLPPLVCGFGALCPSRRRVISPPIPTASSRTWRKKMPAQSGRLGRPWVLRRGALRVCVVCGCSEAGRCQLVPGGLGREGDQREDRVDQQQKFVRAAAARAGLAVEVSFTQRGFVLHTFESAVFRFSKQPAPFGGGICADTATARHSGAGVKMTAATGVFLFGPDQCLVHGTRHCRCRATRRWCAGSPRHAAAANSIQRLKLFTRSRFFAAAATRDRSRSGKARGRSPPAAATNSRQRLEGSTRSRFFAAATSADRSRSLRKPAAPEKSPLPNARSVRCVCRSTVRGVSCYESTHRRLRAGELR